MPPKEARTYIVKLTQVDVPWFLSFGGRLTKSRETGTQALDSLATRQAVYPEGACNKGCAANQQRFAQLDLCMGSGVATLDVAAPYSGHQSQICFGEGEKAQNTQLLTTALPFGRRSFVHCRLAGWRAINSAAKSKLSQTVLGAFLVLVAVISSHLVT